MKLIRANAKGGLFWYCPDSSGRLLTLVMAKHFLGEDGAREIWVRSELSKTLSETPCPSCAKPMRIAAEPGWMGGGTLDVCRMCHLIWVSGEQHAEIPLPEDLIVRGDENRIGGDSTLLADAGRDLAKIALDEERRKFHEDSIFAEEPTGLFKNVAGFFGLPVETGNRVTGATWGLWLLGALCFVIFAYTWNRPAILDDWGYIPSHPFRKFGATIFTSTLLHAGFAHLFANLYFFFVFADDVEESMGSGLFIWFYVCTAIFTAGASYFFSGNPEIPQVGLSGFIMATLAFYALQFGKSKIAFVIPFTQYMDFGAGSGGFVRSFRWLHFPAWVVIGWYLVIDFVLYFFSEKANVGGVAHSAHLAGAVMGAIWWAVYSRPRHEETSRAIEEITRPAIAAPSRKRLAAEKPKLPPGKN